jgi:hypothetical protein
MIGSKNMTTTWPTFVAAPDPMPLKVACAIVFRSASWYRHLEQKPFPSFTLPGQRSQLVTKADLWKYLSQAQYTHYPPPAVALGGGRTDESFLVRKRKKKV